MGRAFQNGETLPSGRPACLVGIHAKVGDSLRMIQRRSHPLLRTTAWITPDDRTNSMPPGNVVEPRLVFLVSPGRLLSPPAAVAFSIAVQAGL